VRYHSESVQLMWVFVAWLLLLIIRVAQTRAAVSEDHLQLKSFEQSRTCDPSYSS